mmetsp:Transcript_1443/g.1828  ORF Transcript_1443/g.1828 Transcript_1443/m.1828 type:complete len:115 (+) Transcript_1443:50-394(+)
MVASYAHRMMMKSRSGGGGLLQQRIMQQLQTSLVSRTTAGSQKSCTRMTKGSLQVQPLTTTTTTTTSKMLRQMSRTALGVEGSLQIVMSTQSVVESNLPRGWDLGIEGEDDDGG